MLILFYGLRVVHVISALFWTGTAFFMVLLLGPSITTLGAQSAPLVRELERRGIFVVMPVVALIAILSGLALYIRAAHLGGAEWMRSMTGMGFGLGGVAAAAGFLIGRLVIKPSARRLSRAAGAERETLQRRILAAERRIAFALLIASIAMAVARYL